VLKKTPKRFRKRPKTAKPFSNCLSNLKATFECPSTAGHAPNRKIRPRLKPRERLTFERRERKRRVQIDRNGRDSALKRGDCRLSKTAVEFSITDRDPDKAAPLEGRRILRSTAIWITSPESIGIGFPADPEPSNPPSELPLVVLYAQQI